MQEQHKLILSPTRVVNVMKSITKPADYMISTDAKQFIYDCALKFAEVIFVEAKAIHRQQGDDIFTGDHIVEAVGKTSDFLSSMDIYPHSSKFTGIARRTITKPYSV